MRRRALVLVVFAFVAAGCGGRNANVVDPATDLHLSGNWNDADSRAVAEALTGQCLADPWIQRFVDANGRPPVVRVAHVHVRVQDLDEVIEPGIVTEDLVKALLVSGKARAVASREEATVGEGAREVCGEMAVNAAHPLQAGHEQAPDFLLGGVIASQNDQVREGGVVSDTFRRVKFYQITLTLTDVTTNELVWTGTAERKKVIEQPSISF